MSSIAEKPAPAKPAKAAKAKKPKVKSSLPPTSVMVQAAIGALKERKGSSLVAIKKYIATNYKVDPVKHSHFIKKALTNGVEKKILLRAKGGGASGSFKLFLFYHYTTNHHMVSVFSFDIIDERRHN